MIQSIDAQIETLNNCRNNAIKSRESMIKIANEFKTDIRVIDKLFEDYHEVKLYFKVNEQLNDKLIESMNEFNYKYSESVIQNDEYVSIFCFDL